MSQTAQLHVSFAGPLVTFQDGGRFGSLRFGVPASGPMDRLAHAAANSAIGNGAQATTIEVSRGGIDLDCVTGSVTLGLAGGDCIVDHRGSIEAGWTVITMRPGERVSVRAGEWGSWSYVAIAGEPVVSRWLGHAATHSMSGLGGGALVVGEKIDIAAARVESVRDGEIPVPDFARSTGRVRVVMGPQDHHFEDKAIVAFRESPYRVTDAFDRMGVRLAGRAAAAARGVVDPVRADRSRVDPGGWRWRCNGAPRRSSDNGWLPEDCDRRLSRPRRVDATPHRRRR